MDSANMRDLFKSANVDNGINDQLELPVWHIGLLKGSMSIVTVDYSKDDNTDDDARVNGSR